MIFNKFFNRFNKSSQTAHTPLTQIPWRDVVDECYGKGLDSIYPIVKVIYTDDKTERVVIVKTTEMAYKTAYEKLSPFSDDELQYISSGLHGYWHPAGYAGSSLFDTEERAINEIYSTPPFKYNKIVIWADTPFRIDTERLYWIKDDGADDPDDLCLHGHAFAKIGDEVFNYNATVSATGLYLLRTLSDNHMSHEGEAMLPCCGHYMIANDDLSSVDISGCPNGIDWSVIHENGSIKLLTETGRETFVDMNDYREEVYAFADKIEAYFQKCLPKNISLDEDEFKRNGYTAFLNEWKRRRK